MVGLQNAAGSIGYIVGPLLAGWAGMMFGNIQAVAGAGLILLIVAVINIAVVPRKIKMPLKQLEALAND